MKNKLNEPKFERIYTCMLRCVFIYVCVYAYKYEKMYVG